MRPPAWLAPILDWYHGLMAGLGDGPTAHYHRVMALRWRLRRTSGLFVTRHAVDRFRERYAPELRRTAAHVALLAVCVAGAPAPDACWARPAESWRAGNVRLVVRERRVVTVLGPELVEPRRCA